MTRTTANDILRQIPVKSLVETENGNTAERQDEQLRRYVDTENFLSENTGDDYRQNGRNDLQRGSEKGEERTLHQKLLICLDGIGHLGKNSERF